VIFENQLCLQRENVPTGDKPEIKQQINFFFILKKGKDNQKMCCRLL